jgi:hypothetical protein
MDFIISELLKLRKEWLKARKNGNRELAEIIASNWQALKDKLTPEEKDEYYQEVNKL